MSLLCAFMIGTAIAGLSFLVLPLLLVARARRPRFSLPVVSRLLSLRRRESVRRELAGALLSLATSVRAGLSLPQAIRAAAASLPGPLGDEFSQVDTDLSHGAGLDQALSSLEKRYPIAEMKLMVAGLRVARASGGGLAPLLEKLAETMRERERLRGQVHALTAQGRLSGWVVGMIPLVLMVMIFLLDPEFIRPMFSTYAGWLLLGLAAALELIGAFAIRAVIRVEP